MSETTTAANLANNPERLLGPGNVTHEDYVQAVRAAVLARVAPEVGKRISSAKVVYGAGAVNGARGVTFFGAWKNGQVDDLIEVCAGCEEHPIQVAGTTVHELAHVLAGPTAGHGKAWKEAAAVLGLVDAKAAGQNYEASSFADDLRQAIESIPQPTDGRPNLGGVRAPRATTPRPCSVGRGSRGGKSFGAGSGSRLRLWECKCERPVKVRVASDSFAATCDLCGEKFERK